MNFKKHIITMIAAVGIILNLGVNCYAATESVNIPVTYSVDENKLYNLILNVGEGGVVYDGDQTVENGTVIYELKVEDIKEFKVSANKNNKIKSIVLNGVDIKEEFKNESNEQSIQVKGVGGDSKLDIKFESIENVNNSSEKPNKNPNENKPNKKPIGSVNTGDRSNILILVILLIASIIIIVKYYNNSKKKSNK